MKIDKQIKLWAQIINESEDNYRDYDNPQTIASPHSRVQLFKDSVYITPDTRHGYYNTVSDLMAAQMCVTQRIQSFHPAHHAIDRNTEVHVTRGGNRSESKYVSDVIFEKGLLILNLTDIRGDGLLADSIIGKLPSNAYKNDGAILRDAEIVTEEGYRVERIEGTKGLIKLVIDDEYELPELRNPRVKNGKVNEDEESPITMFFRTSPDIDDKAGKITFTSINEMKNFIESVGGEYSEQIADGFTQGKLMPVDLKQPIQQLAIQQPK